MGIFLFIIAIVISGIMAQEFYEIAEMKGHPCRKYFWWSFLFTFAGWAMVIALPDHSNVQQKIANTTTADELPEL